MKKDLTEIIFIVDESGSMGGTRMDTIGGFNTFIDDQKKAPGEANVTLTKFSWSEKVEVAQDGVPISEVKEMTPENYRPGGCTALYDAIGKTITQVGVRLANTPEELRPEKVIVVVMTDGEENDSKDYNNTKIKEMVVTQETDYNWEFVFLGANIDSFEAGRLAGFASAKTMNFKQSAGGIQDAYASMSDNMTSYRNGSKASMDFENKDYDAQAKYGVDNKA